MLDNVAVDPELGVIPEFLTRGFDFFDGEMLDLVHLV